MLSAIDYTSITVVLAYCW